MEMGAIHMTNIINNLGNFSISPHFFEMGRQEVKIFLIRSHVASIFVAGSIVGLNKDILHQTIPTWRNIILKQNTLMKSSKDDLDGLYRDYKNAVKRYIQRLCKNPETVDDLLQETFTKAVKYFHTFSSEKGSFYTWICRIARNVYFQNFKREKHYPDIFLGENSEQEVFVSKDYSESMETEVLLQQVREIVVTLPEPERSIVILKKLNNYKLHKTAESLGLSPRTVSRRLINAQNMIRKELERRQLL